MKRADGVKPRLQNPGGWRMTKPRYRVNSEVELPICNGTRIQTLGETMSNNIIQCLLFGIPSTMLRELGMFRRETRSRRICSVARPDPRPESPIPTVISPEQR